MKRYFLTKLSIEGFRGINNESDPLVLKLRADAVNSVFAPNALGKSSIFDALSYAIRGTIPKLDSLPAAENADAYYTNLFHSSQTGTIALTFKPDNGDPEVEIVVQRTSKGTRIVSSPSGCADPDALLLELDGESILLDHRTFDTFVEDTPLRRGRTFSSLLGLGPISQFRQALEVLSNAKNLKSDLDLDALRTEYRHEVAERDAALSRIRIAFKAFVGSMLPEPIDRIAVSATAMTALSSIPLTAPFASGTFADVKFGDVRTAVKAAEGGPDRDRLAKVLRDISALELAAANTDEPGDQTQLRSELLRRKSALAQTEGDLFQKLYEAAEPIVTQVSWSDQARCPLCRTTALPIRIAEHVAEHLELYADAKAAQAAIRDLWKRPWVVRADRLCEKFCDASASSRWKLLDDMFRTDEPTESGSDEAISLLTNLKQSGSQPRWPPRKIFRHPGEYWRVASPETCWHASARHGSKPTARR